MAKLGLLAKISHSEDAEVMTRINISTGSIQVIPHMGGGGGDCDHILIFIIQLLIP